MSDETQQFLKRAAAAGTEGVLIVGLVAEVRAVAPGVDRQTNQPYDGYMAVRVVTGLGQSASVKLGQGAGAPKNGDKCVFFCSRVWRGREGISAQADSFI